MDVLGHVTVEFFERFDIGRASAAARDLFVLDAPQLVVLLPQVGLDDLGGGEKPEDRGIARVQVAMSLYVSVCGDCGDRMLERGDGRDGSGCYARCDE
jgi:hypothetical protein